MGAHENKQAAQDAYEAFGKGDAEGAMRNMDDSVAWTVRGDNALTGTYNGKQASAGYGARSGARTSEPSRMTSSPTARRSSCSRRSTSRARQSRAPTSSPTTAVGSS